MAGRQSIEVRPLQVFGDEVVEPLLILRGIKLLGNGYAVRVLDIFEDLSSQRSLADRLEPGLEIIEIVFPGKPGILVLEALKITEGIIINDTHEAKEFEKRVLKRRCGEEHLGRMGNRCFYSIGDPVRGLIHIPQMVRLVNDDEVPLDLLDVSVLAPGEMIRTDDDVTLIERIEVSFPYLLIETLRFQDKGREKELVGQLLVPLLSQTGGHDDEKLSLSFGPFLGKEDAGFDSFP